MIVDTDVLIWYARANQAAVDVIHGLPGFSISVVTYMEIVQGARNKTELKKFKKALTSLNATVQQISEMISTRAMFFMEQYALSHSMELADALIGATAVVTQEPLVTGNAKQYRHLPDIRIERFSP